jgi:hypothetical protein
MSGSVNLWRRSVASSSSWTLTSGSSPRRSFFYLRRHCNKLLRHAVHMWANLSRKSCPWAAVYYEQLRTRGKSHACALRCLGQRWLKILWLNVTRYRITRGNALCSCGCNVPNTASACLASAPFSSPNSR